MQPFTDTVSVFGSRHAIRLDPVHRCIALPRYSHYDQVQTMHLAVGVELGGRRVMFPFAPRDKYSMDFDFLDQRLTPGGIDIRGIDAMSKLRVRLRVAAPFRPRDLDFSTVPVIAIRVEVDRLSANFRWTRPAAVAGEARLFCRVTGGGASLQPFPENAIDIRWHDNALRSRYAGPEERSFDLPQHDRLCTTDGERHDQSRGLQSTPEFFRDVAVPEQSGAALTVLWSTHQPPVLDIRGTKAPFYYHRHFADLEAVASWGAANVEEIIANDERVAALIAVDDCGPAARHLLSYTLHSWLMNTWCVDPPGSNRPHFTVWEGSCYYHSTVDVEYTQAPFYLAVWPELLEWQLHQWTDFTKSGELALGESGAGTRFLSHDMGDGGVIDHQHYPHEMEVEETTNWLILAWAHYRRTGIREVIDAHPRVIRDFLAFVEACDTTGSGIPDKGVANTIDDGAPAIQYGRDQIYLAVKVLAAYTVGADMLALHGDEAGARHYRELASTVRGRIHLDGWADDHFVTLLDKNAEGLVDPWTKQPLRWKEVPGWDAAHIYTVNGVALLDMIGRDLGLDPERLRTDLRTATRRCLTTYGCTHTDFANHHMADNSAMEGLAAASRNPGWVSMNMLRDFAALYRGVDLRGMAERYWSWQMICNTQDAKMFHETFNGNDLCQYPRGVVWWGLFDALAGRVLDVIEGRDECAFPLGPMDLPDLPHADWRAGTAPRLECRNPV